MNRRSYLRGVGIATAVGLAGCTNGKSQSTRTDGDAERSRVFEDSNAFNALRYAEGTFSVQLDKFPYIAKDWQPVTQVTVASEEGDIVLGPKEFTYGDRVYNFDIPNKTTIYRVLAVFNESEGDWESKSNAVDELRVEISDGAVRILERNQFSGNSTT